MKSALVLYPNQLFPVSVLPQVDTIILVEEPLFFGTDREFPLKLHKQKLILHRASMRRYVEEVLWPGKYEVEYIDLDVLYDSSDILSRAKKFEQLYIIDPMNDTLVRRLLEARREHPDSPELQFLPSPNFYLKDADVRQYLVKSHPKLFADFYQWQRERFNILIGDDYKPLGGEWCLEPEKNERLPKGQALPSFQVYGDNVFVHEAIEFVNQHFSDNPGSTDFIWPTSHEEAAKWLEEFIANRLEHFGPYENALDGQAAWLYHSAIAGSLNIGLLSPQQVIEAALKRHAKHPVPLQSLESFIRHILGRREFLRGMYLTRQTSLRRSNTFKHHRKLTGAWYGGNLAIPPFDDVVKKINAHAYAHQNERMMIVGNLMLLAEIHPDEVHRWFSELFIDAYDWVTVPTVYGAIEFADESLLGRPSISSSHYILQMGHYERGVWSDVWDGLFWRFVERHRTLLARYPQTRVMVQRLERLDSDHRRIIGYRAEDFLARYTLL
jgi:deoxyribodipyrimidine photolyase-related protein